MDGHPSLKQSDAPDSLHDETLRTHAWALDGPESQEGRSDGTGMTWVRPIGLTSDSPDAGCHHGEVPRPRQGCGISAGQGRRLRDSNPGWAVDPNRISSAAP
jgi:hypothetical protein